MGQRWRIWDPAIIFSEKKSTSLNATRLSRKIQNQDLREMKGINENGGFEWTVHPSDVEFEIKERDLKKIFPRTFLICQQYLDLSDSSREVEA